MSRLVSPLIGLWLWFWCMVVLSVPFVHADEPAPAPVSLNVVVANLHVLAGIPHIPKEGLTREAVLENLERAVALFRQEKADVLLLQEVDLLAQRTGLVEQPKELASRLSMHAVEATTYDSRDTNEPVAMLRDCRFGLAILSRFPIRKHWEVSLSDSAQTDANGRALELRKLLVAEVEAAPGRTLLLATAHLDDRSAATRAKQMERIRETLAPLAEKSPVLLAGDFNEPRFTDRSLLSPSLQTRHDWQPGDASPWSWPSEPRFSTLTCPPLPATYPYPNAVVDIDRLHVLGCGLRVTHLERLDSQGISDHYFLKGVLSLE